ncbi:hypothetical protein CCHL11_02201 [Colletotrichum chlorophyti]|uniref:Nuclear pore protein n=1 Tax=Colletotrichum chlorophyti TaxID=708187 RepID=A0A1Q8S6T4_9PEZI|nr:hypothetical protein CCHL11_02201 [Colletotrichum chlorophyti]
MTFQKELAFRPAVAADTDDFDTDIESEWIRTPSECTLADEDELQIDPSGDLLLQVGSDPFSGESKSIRVCCHTLRRASPFWKRTLFETSAENKLSDAEWWGWTPSLFACQHDKIDGLLILLNIIHSEFHLVPREPSLTEIYQTLCLASLYEMEHVLQPWIRRWNEVIRTAEASRSGHDLGKLACIAWALGDERLFSRTIVKISLTSVIDKQGHVTTADGVCLDDYIFDCLGSPAISDCIRSLRNRLAMELPSHLNRLINQLIDGRWLCAGISGIPVTRDKKCDYIVLGSVFAGLIYVRGTRTTEIAISEGESVSDLLKSLKRVLSYMTCFEKHPDCNPAGRIAEAMRETIDEVDLSLNTDCLQRMRKQRRKIGLEATEDVTSDG